MGRVQLTSDRLSVEEVLYGNDAAATGLSDRRRSVPVLHGAKGAGPGVVLPTRVLGRNLEVPQGDLLTLGVSNPPVPAPGKSAFPVDLERNARLGLPPGRGIGERWDLRRLLLSYLLLF